jgi:hypothetical protein
MLNSRLWNPPRIDPPIHLSRLFWPGSVTQLSVHVSGLGLFRCGDLRRWVRGEQELLVFVEVGKPYQMSLLGPFGSARIEGQVDANTQAMREPAELPAWPGTREPLPVLSAEARPRQRPFRMPTSIARIIAHLPLIRAVVPVPTLTARPAILPYTGPKNGRVVWQNRPVTPSVRSPIRLPQLILDHQSERILEFWPKDQQS